MFWLCVQCFNSYGGRGVKCCDHHEHAGKFQPATCDKMSFDRYCTSSKATLHVYFNYFHHNVYFDVVIGVQSIYIQLLHEQSWCTNRTGCCFVHLKSWCCIYSTSRVRKYNMMLVASDLMRMLAIYRFLHFCFVLCVRLAGITMQVYINIKVRVSCLYNFADMRDG